MSDIHGAVGAYVADALDPAERAAFAEHMSQCRLCASEVRSLTETVAELSASVATPPPPQLRDQVLRAARQVRPLPPLPQQADRGAERGAESPESSTVARGADDSRDTERSDSADADRSVAAATNAPAESGARAAPPKVGTRGGRRSRTVTALRWPGNSKVLRGLAAAALVAVVMLGGWVVQLRGAADQQQQQVATAQRAENELFAAADVRTRHLQLQSGGTLAVVASAEQGRALVLGPDLPPPSAGREYQVWLMRDGLPLPSSHFADGADRVWLTGDLAGVQALAVTIEPAGGSKAPTTPVLGSVEM